MSMVDPETLLTGIQGLDELLGSITLPYTMLIAGYPGSGKTTLAMQICYNSAVKRGLKCLYITFYEDKDKLYRYMSRLGMNLYDVESKGLIRFLKLPVTNDLETLVSEVNKVLTEDQFKVVVIDSISVVLDAIREEQVKRAWLLNYFYQLSTFTNGLLILVAELPFGEEKIRAGSIEFMADAIIVLKYRVEHGFLTRFLEVRKARGAQVNLVETSFTITNEKGVSIHTPPILASIPYEGEEVNIPEKSLRDYVDHYHRGFLVSFIYPPQAFPGLEALLHILGVAIVNDMKTLIVSFTTPSETLVEILVGAFTDTGFTLEEAKSLLEKYFIVTSLNPYGYSPIQLLSQLESIIEKTNPHIVVLHGIENLIEAVSRGITHKFIEIDFNQKLYFKARKILAFKIISCIDEEICNFEISSSDVVYRFSRHINEREQIIETYIYVHRRRLEPFIVKYDFNAHLKEIYGVIRQHVGKLEKK